MCCDAGTYVLQKDFSLDQGYQTQITPRVKLGLMK